MLGESSNEIGERYQIASSTIRSRAKREGWTTPRNVTMKLRERSTAIRAQQIRGELTHQQAETKLEEVDAIATSIAQQQKDHQMAISNLIGKKLSKPKMKKLPDIKSWKDLDTADRIMRRTLEMDKDSADTIINVGILGTSGIIDDYED